MYSNERKNGFSILELLVKIIFAAIFIFILVWLFQKKIPNVNMTPFYSNVFRENIKYMQEAGEGYFTTDKLPKETGESVKLTLEEMESMNIILPFVDQDGNACDKTNSYVSITKLEGDLGYELKTNLVCGKESNFVTKTLGCHVYCPNNGVKCDCNCNGEKTCSFKQVTQYQFKKQVKTTTTKYSCDKGYTLKDKYCFKTVLKDSKSAIVTTVSERLDTKPATALTTTDKKAATAVTTTDKKDATAVKSTDTKPATAVEKTYVCEKTKTEKQCTNKTEKKPYSCNCKTTIINGKSTTTCNTCYEDVKVQSCKDVDVIYHDNCTKTVYNCDNYKGYTLSGQKCVKTTTTYNCNKYSGYTLEGTKCIKSNTTYNCNKYNGYKLEGSNCVKTTTTYNCNSYSGYTLSGTKCNKVIKETSTVKSCPSNYKLEGNKCNLYSTTKVKAKSKTTTGTTTKYKWSTSKKVSGWTATGKTRTVKGEKVCK